MVLRKAVREPVGGPVRRKPEAAEHGRQRRSEQTEIERELGRRLLEDVHAGDLRPELRLAGRTIERLDRSDSRAAQRAGSVNDAVQRPEPLPRARDGVAHLVEVRDVGRDDDASVEACADGLASAAHFLRRRASRELALKRMPELRFRYDPSLALGAQTLDLLRDLERETAPEAQGEAAPDDET